jgi:REP element-mobilizing transposase RayT
MRGRAHGRRSIRLRGFDYSRSGAYFVTICVQDRACVFGNVVDGRMCLSAAGLMVRRVWDELPRFYAGVGIDAFVVMPNHVHGIVILSGGVRNGLDDGAAARGRPSSSGPGQAQGPAPTVPLWGPAPTEPLRGPAPTEPWRGAGTTDTVDSVTVEDGRGTNGQSGRPMTVGDVMHRFKTLTTRLYIVGVRDAQWPPSRRRLWQRDYYERIVRDASALRRIRIYIERNPLRWCTAAHNPIGKEFRR